MLMAELRDKRAEELREDVLPTEWPKVKCEKCGRTIARGIIRKGQRDPVAIQCWSKGCRHLNVF